jgi:hypothetical protein
MERDPAQAEGGVMSLLTPLTPHRDERLLEAELLRAVRRSAARDLDALAAAGRPEGRLRAAREALASATTLEQAIALEPLIAAARAAVRS